jgi:predicted SprT family Zn-dependent metalloprotease
MQADNRRFTLVHNFDQAFDHFNRTLFAGQLPPCVITLQRSAGHNGYFRPQAFHARPCAAAVTEAGATAHEIALNPAAFHGRTDADILSTLVHEMVHLWQEVAGKPGRGRYHNRQWAAMMVDVGLLPFNLHDPAKQTGDACSHRIAPGGRFAVACAAFLAAAGPVIPWQAAGERPSAAARKRNKVTYRCPACAATVWGRASLHLVCGDCGVEFVAADGEDGGGDG